MDVIKVLFKDRIAEEETALYEADNKRNRKFSYSRKAAKNVEKLLSRDEILSVGKMVQAWTTGKAMTETQKRL